MDRQKLESSATLAALLLLALTLFGAVIAIADVAFAWDLLSERWERVAGFLLGSSFALLLGCVLVSVMLNLSIIAQKLAQAVDRDQRDR
jgi:hypothetical protein